MGKTIKPSKISKDGKTMTYGYSLNCDENVVVSAITSPDDSWLDVSGDGSKSGNLTIRVPQNIGSDRGSIIKVGILNTESGRMSYSCTEIVIEQEGDGTSGCKYDVTIVPTETLSCGDEVTITWTKKTDPTPTPTECDNSIKIYYGQQEGSATIDCSVDEMQLTTKATETCNATGIWKQASPYDAAGSSGNLVQIGTLSGCEGTWTFYGGEDIVTGITANGNKIMGVVKQNTTGSLRYKNITAMCSNGCSNPFEIWQNAAPEPTNYKWFATYTGGNTASADCDTSNTTINKDDVDLESLRSVKIGECVTTIGQNAFGGCTSLTSVTIPNNVTTIGRNAFLDCNSLPTENNIRYADSYAVKATDKTLATYALKIGTRFIGSSAFIGCTSITGLTIPSSVILISNDAFSGCTSLTGLTIPNSVTHIDASAFRSCTSLASITIPESVVYIGSYTFYDCINLESITCLATTPPRLDGTSVFGGSTCPIYVPSQSVNAYKEAQGWSNYETRISPIQQ